MEKQLEPSNDIMEDKTQETKVEILIDDVEREDRES